MGYTHSVETRAKISASNRRRRPTAWRLLREKRNNEIIAYAKANPQVNQPDIAKKFGLLSVNHILLQAGIRHRKYHHLRRGTKQTRAVREQEEHARREARKKRREEKHAPIIAYARANPEVKQADIAKLFDTHQSPVSQILIHAGLARGRGKQNYKLLKKRTNWTDEQHQWEQKLSALGLGMDRGAQGLTYGDISYHSDVFDYEPR